MPESISKDYLEVKTLSGFVEKLRSHIQATRDDDAQDDFIFKLLGYLWCLNGEVFKIKTLCHPRQSTEHHFEERIENDQELPDSAWEDCDDTMFESRTIQSAAKVIYCRFKAAGIDGVKRLMQEDLTSIALQYIGDCIYSPEIKEAFESIDFCSSTEQTSHSNPALSRAQRQLNELVRKKSDLTVEDIGLLRVSLNWLDQKIHFRSPTTAILYQEDTCSQIEKTKLIPTNDTITKQRLESLVSWINQAMNQSLEPQLIAAAASVWFQSIHPFQDKNTRTSALLRHYILRRANLAIDAQTTPPAKFLLSAGDIHGEHGEGYGYPDRIEGKVIAMLKHMAEFSVSAEPVHKSDGCRIM